MAIGIEMSNSTNWRLAYEAGDEFIRRHLYQYSDNEEDFTTRQRLAYCPAYAKTLINEICSKLASQLHTVSRTSSPKVMARYSGEAGGVDGRNTNMTAYITADILPELLMQGRVGVAISKSKRYGHVYKLYQSESILDYSERDGELVNVKLQQYTEEGKSEVLLLHKRNSTVSCQINNEPASTLDVDFIPFVLFDVKRSFMADIWRHQVALLNLEASDLYYTYMANYPRYTEQRDARAENSFTPKDATGAKQKQGVLKGRVYGKDLDRPGFIHPSPEPLYASMKKEEQIKDEMARLLDVSLSELGGEGVDSGLTRIASELERCEQQLGTMFAEMLLNPGFNVVYPTIFTLKSDEDRIEEASKLSGTMASVPSVSYRKEVCKQIARLTLQGKVPSATLAAIESEINNRPVIIQDPEKLVDHVDAGIIDRVSAALALGYTAEGAVKAMEEKKDLMQHIYMAQENKQDIAARTGGDREMGTGDAKDEKTLSQDKAVNER